jgi:organic hydroperoxide reductase OsmC/OhrA
MNIQAEVKNSREKHTVVLRTNNAAHPLVIPSKSTGFGSSVNGGELLFLALATCYCNDIYREASKRGISVTAVEVIVEGEFGAEGEPAKNVAYRARVTADAPEEVIKGLMVHTDGVAEIQNTMRIGVPIRLGKMEGVRVQPGRTE